MKMLGSLHDRNAHFVSFSYKQFSQSHCILLSTISDCAAYLRIIDASFKIIKLFVLFK